MTTPLKGNSKYIAYEKPERMVTPTLANCWSIVRNVCISIPLANEQFANNGSTVNCSEFSSDRLQIRRVSSPYHFPMVPQTANDRPIICTTWV